jgi:hypothetical protein
LHGSQRVLAGGLPRDTEQPAEIRERRRAAAAFDGAQHARAGLEMHGRVAGEIPGALEGLGRQQDLVQERRDRDVATAEQRSAPCAVVIEPSAVVIHAQIVRRRQ